MMNDLPRPQQTVVYIIQQKDGLWRVGLGYPDGETFHSVATYATEEDAARAADQWITENAVPNKLN